MKKRILGMLLAIMLVFLSVDTQVLAKEAGEGDSSISLKTAGENALPITENEGRTFGTAQPTEIPETEATQEPTQIPEVTAVPKQTIAPEETTEPTPIQKPSETMEPGTTGEPTPLVTGSPVASIEPGNSATPEETVDSDAFASPTTTDGLEGSPSATPSLSPSVSPSATPTATPMAAGKVEANFLSTRSVTLIWPVPNHTSKSRDYSDGSHEPKHEAIDIQDGTINGATIVAAISGTVTKKYTCSSQHYGDLHNCNGVGTGMCIQGDDGRFYQYAHMLAGSIPAGIDVGVRVSAGQTIGQVGSTGSSSGAHLHFRIAVGSEWGTTVNPSTETYSYVSGTESTTFPLIDGQYYYIRNCNAGKVLDSEGSAEGARVVINDKVSGRTSQMWRAVKQADGYSFISAATGYAMDVYGYSTENMAEIMQFSYHGNTNQRFSLVDRGNGYYSIHPICSGLGLDVYYAWTDNGTPVIQYGYHGGNNMLWSFEVCDTVNPSINSVYYSDRNRDRFTVVANVSDNIGVTKVLFPTWRADIQTGEDAIWVEGIRQPDGTWAATIELSNYGSAETEYITHVYAYDAAGNYASGGIGTFIDRTPPKATDVKMERVAENKIRISCIVSDRSEIERVVFPTWTEYNGQDDIADDWYNNCKGTKEGNEWVWYVYDSQHNFEKGTYLTHIYAYDIFGNGAYVGGKSYSFANSYKPAAFTYEGHTYEIYDDLLTWSEAKTKCEQLGGHLVTITSQGEQNAIAQAIRSQTRLSYFIGGKTVEGKPVWITSEKFEYTNWYPSEPNNWNGIENVYQLYRDESGQWNDVADVKSDTGFICEYEIVDSGDIPDGGIPEDIWLAGITDIYYTGSAIVQPLRVYDGEKLLEKNVDYTFSCKNNKNAYIYAEEDYEAFEENRLKTGKRVKTGTFDPAKAPQITIKMKGNYSGSQTIYFQIKPAEITYEKFVTANLAATYSGKKQTPAPSLMWNGKILKYGTDFYVPEYDSAKNDKYSFTVPQTYNLTVVGKNNFTGQIPITLTISENGKQIAMNKVTVKGIKGLPWKGEQLTQNDYKVTWQKDVLSEENGDYTVSWGTNTDVGTGTVTFTGTGIDADSDGYSYIGSKTVYFKITGTAMSKIIVSGVEKNYVYTGAEIKPQATLTYKKDKNTEAVSLMEGVHYTVSYQKNVEKGTATIIFTGMESGGYTGTRKTTFKINASEIADKQEGENLIEKAKVTFVDAANVQNGVYSAPYMKGGAKPEISVNCGEKVLEAGKDYTVSYANNKKIALSTDKNAPIIIIRGKGNYTGSKRVCFSIVAKALSNENGITVVANDKVENAKKNGYRQNFKVYDADGVILGSNDYDTKNVVYTLIQVENEGGIVSTVNKVLDKTSSVSEGSLIKITVTGKGAYAGGTATGTYRILENGRDISKSTIQIADQIYTGKAITITNQNQFVEGKVYIKVGQEKMTLVLGKDIEIVEGSHKNNVKKGTASVMIRGIGDYGGTKTVKFKIKAKSFIWWWKK